MSRSFEPMPIMFIGDLALSDRIVPRVERAVRGPTIADRFMTDLERAEAVTQNVETGAGQR